MNAKMQRKLAGLFAAVVLVLICLAVRITYVNAVSGDQYAKQVLAQSQSQYSSTVLPFKRGDILDTKGTVLATSEKKYNIVLDCKVVNSDPDYAGPTMKENMNEAMEYCASHAPVLGLSIPISSCARVLFPQPDSPTMPSVSPRRICKSIPLSAWRWHQSPTYRQELGHASVCRCR